MLSSRTLCFETHHSAKFQTAAHRLVSTFSACAAAEISIGAMGSVGSATATGTEPASRSTQLRKRAKPASTFVRMSSCRLGAYAPSRRKPSRGSRPYHSQNMATPLYLEASTPSSPPTRSP